jgi:hypothetical protein
MKCKGRVICIFNFALCIAAAACAPRRVVLPTDTGTPFPDFAAVHQQVSSSCRGVRTLRGVLNLRGRVAMQRISGTVHAGFERPASMRLEGVPPFGQPVFILAAQGGTAVLLLPRDGRVVRGEPPQAILEALIGVDLAPADLQAILTGCVVPDPSPTGGRLHANGWASIDLHSGARLYLRRTSQWELRAARRDGWQIEYTIGQSRYPQTVRLVSESPIQVDFSAAISELEANVDLDAAAFRVDAPADAKPLMLEELREGGPLRTQ